MPSQPNTFAHVHAFVVYRHRHHSAIMKAEYAMSETISGLLHPYRISRVDQYAGCYLECLLRTAHHHDLVVFASHTASGPDVVRNGRPEFLQPHGVAVIQGFCEAMPATAHDKAIPY